jgi:hypothetical protein
MTVPRPKDRVTLTGPCLDGRHMAVGSFGTVIEVPIGRPTWVRVRWDDGRTSVLFYGADDFTVTSTFVACPACGTADVFDLAQDPDTGVVTCSCGNEYDPKDHHP